MSVLIKALLIALTMVLSLHAQAATTYTQSIKNGVISFTPVPVVVPPIVIVPPVTMPPMASMPYVDMTKVMTPAVGRNFIDVIRRDPLSFPMPRSGNEAEFRISCPPSHMLADDPLVKPNQAGGSHLHTFFGNTGANANSTSTSLLATGNSTCDGGIMDRSAMWVPSIIDTRTGTPIAPDGSNIYYKTGDADVVQAVPHGLHIIAGDMKASTAQDEMHWTCLTKDDANVYGKDFGYIPVCQAPNYLKMVVAFPSCWDGVNLDSTNHKSHMSYSCDAAHQVHIPVISYNIAYRPTAADDTSKWRLSSDMYDAVQPGGYSMHGDYMAAWTVDPETNKVFSDVWYEGCMLTKANCGNDKIGDGRVFQY